MSEFTFVGYYTRDSGTVFAHFNPVAEGEHPMGLNKRACQTRLEYNRNRGLPYEAFERALRHWPKQQ